MPPGFTLNESTGAARIRKLEETRLNIQINILQALDKIALINHELKSTQMRTPNREERVRQYINHFCRLHGKGI